MRLHASLYRQNMLKRRFTRQIYMNTRRAESAKMRRVHFAINAFDFVLPSSCAIKVEGQDIYVLSTKAPIYAPKWGLKKEIGSPLMKKYRT